MLLSFCHRNTEWLFAELKRDVKRKVMRSFHRPSILPFLPILVVLLVLFLPFTAGSGVWPPEGAGGGFGTFENALP